MTDLSQMIRWNANFVRGLAESVLNRAKVIRTSLTSGSAEAAVKTQVALVAKKFSPTKTKSVARKSATKKESAKKSAVKRATSPRRRTKSTR